jgi:hypothetical protein
MKYASSDSHYAIEPSDEIRQKTALNKVTASALCFDEMKIFREGHEQ